jgi:hypothetical protein
MPLFRRRRPSITREQLLAAVPVSNTSVSVSADDAGLVTLTIPWRRTRRMAVLAALMMLPSAQRRRVVELDEVGSAVYRLCDGTRSVKTIVDIFAQRYRLSAKEATLAITAYLDQLARRGIVALMVPNLEGRRAPETAPRAARRRR